MSSRPNWYGDHPPACTCAKCTERRRGHRVGGGPSRWRSSKSYPSKDPRPGHRWVQCTTCNGTGEIISGWSAGADGGKIRCPSCFRLGWVQEPTKSEPRKKQPSDSGSNELTPMWDWLKEPIEEEELERSSEGERGGGASKPTVEPLQDAKEKGQRRRRRPIWADLPSQRQPPPTQGPPKYQSPPRLPTSVRVNPFFWIPLAVIVAIVGCTSMVVWSSLQDDTSSEPTATRVAATVPVPTSSPTSPTLQPTIISTPTPTRTAITSPARSFPTSTARPTPTMVPRQTPSRTPTVTPTTIRATIPTTPPRPTPIPTLPPAPTPVPVPTLSPAPTAPPVSTPPSTPEPVGAVNRLSKQEIVELREYALELINNDRADHGVAPLILGNNPAAQMHAEDMLEHDYFGHWWLDGQKPYMVYSATGGTSYAAENVSSWGWTSVEWKADKCDTPSVRCRVPSPRLAIREHQWGMMYDDAHANWGHRDNIVDEGHRAVNIGIAFNNRRVTFIQHFEGGNVEAVEPPTLNKDGFLALSIRKNVAGLEIFDSIAVYYDPPPEPMTPDEIDSLDGYCVGGGAISSCDEPIAYVLEPPPPGWHYDLESNDVIADVWEEDEDSLRVTAQIGQLVTKLGVYTVLLWRDSSTDQSGQQLLELSILPEQ